MPDFPVTPTLPIKRTDLEYPTEDVSLIYLYIIDKMQFMFKNFELVTIDNFTDKAIDVPFFVQGGNCNVACVRYDVVSGVLFQYYIAIDPSKATADVELWKKTDAGFTQLGAEAVDLNANEPYVVELSVAGSSLKVFREGIVFNINNRPSNLVITATDTDIASGKVGINLHRLYIDSTGVFRFATNLCAYLRSPASPLTSPDAIVEYDVIGDGSEENPYRPDMPEDIIQDETYGNVNTLAVTWGAIDYKGEPTMLCAIYEQSPEYLRKDRVMTHIEYVKKKNLMVIKTPRTLREVNEMYRKIRGERKEMMITVNELAYHLLGRPELEIDAVADFYERELLDLNRIKKVPTWELHRTLRRWEELGKRYRRENAIKKLAKVRRR